MIKPHGGVLINRIVSNEDEKKEILEQERYLPKLFLNEYQFSDLEMIATGAFSPLEGFMNKSDYENVLENMRLKNGVIWSMPVTLDIKKDENIKETDKVALYYNNKFLGIINVEEKYEYNKRKEALSIYKTEDEKHPGVKKIYSQGEFYLGGKINLVSEIVHNDFLEYRYTPNQVREIFKKKNWEKITAFQTRNPIHRAHEYILKCALEISDGIFLHPIVGKTKQDDIPAEIRMRCYEILIEKYFPEDRIILAVNPAYMRYGGPREAILHAIVRKNYGCTNIIIGRDHAGVGNYYGPYDAQKIFLEFNEEELEIKPLFFENAFYCRKCESMATEKTCPHSQNDRLSLSGTKVRELLSSGEIPPKEFTRPEIANILIEWWRKK
jgi:sulfate adenylyltransferase